MIHCVVFREGVRKLDTIASVRKTITDIFTIRKIAFFLMGIDKNAVNQKSVSR